jgi:hypothetical protein
MPGAIEFFRTIEHLSPIILTACPKSNYAHVAGQKVAWVREHLSASVTVLPVLGGSSKPLFMHAQGDVLIDDYRRNTEAWEAAGGVAILHRGFDITTACLAPHLPGVGNAQDSNTVSRLIARIREREAGGREVYGTTVDRADLGSAEWFRHFEDEMIDGLLYLRRLGQTMGVTP